MAYSLLFSLPGAPSLRYGEEIGMGDDLSLKERNSVRTPMQWSTEPNGGFTKNPKPVAPVISGGAYGFEHVNVAQQRRDPDSMLNWTERIVRMRKEVPEIGWGDFEILRTDSPEVLAIRYDWRNNSVVILHNLSAAPLEARFQPLSARAKTQDKKNTLLVNLLSDDHSQPEKGGKHCVLLEPYGYRWFRVGGLDYILKRASF